MWGQTCSSESEWVGFGGSSAGGEGEPAPRAQTHADLPLPRHRPRGAQHPAARRWPRRQRPQREHGGARGWGGAGRGQHPLLTRRLLQEGSGYSSPSGSLASPSSAATSLSASTGPSSGFVSSPSQKSLQSILGEWVPGWARRHPTRVAGGVVALSDPHTAPQGPAPDSGTRRARCCTVTPTSPTCGG